MMPRQFGHVTVNVAANIGLRTSPGTVRTSGQYSPGTDGGLNIRAIMGCGREHHPATRRHVLKCAGAPFNRRAIADVDPVLHAAERSDHDIIAQYRKSRTGADIASVVAAAKP